MSESTATDEIEKGPFEPAWESLGRFQLPQWFGEAKFGIWSHWGPQSVPMYGDWYARHMYVEGHLQYLHHWRNYGHPSRNGWKDIIPLWKAERFDPQALMQLYVDAGAKYFVAQANHHDNFDNWNSRHHRWNSVNMGPQRDIVGLWAAAARKQGLHFGVTEHLGASYRWFETSKHADQTGPYAGIAYDGDSQPDLYHRNRGNPLIDAEGKWHWYTDNAEFHQTWYRRIKDLVDQHQPDLLYSDGGLPFYRQVEEISGHKAVPVNCPDVGLKAVAHLYNLSARLHGGINQAVYTQKDTTAHVAAIGVLDIERAQENQIKPYVWQTDTCVGDWFYNIRQVYKTPRHVIEMLVDIVSKNGNLLLNLPQRPDGTLDDECLEILKTLTTWTRAYGEGIYATRPWKVAGEGPTVNQSKLWTFKEEAAAWTTADFRFTTKGSRLFAFQMGHQRDNRQAFIRSLGLESGIKVKSAKVLGTQGGYFRQYADGLLVEFPPSIPCQLVPCIAVDLIEGSA
jgi:alpha-L-fucosidase